MKKVPFISLLFVAVFLIGSSGVVSAVCMDHDNYTCARTVYHYGESIYFASDCVSLCYDDPFDVTITDFDFFSCLLYPATSYEHLLGTFDSMEGSGACSVDFKGRSIIVKLSFIPDDGYVNILNCAPCNNCCFNPSPSDERYKKEIQPLASSLDNVMQLRGVSYAWRTEEYQGRGFMEGRQIGLIAQEVEKVYPELVRTDGNGYKAIFYDKLVPVLIEAVKEQQKEIKERDDRIEKLENALQTMDKRIAAIESPTGAMALK